MEDLRRWGELRSTQLSVSVPLARAAWAHVVRGPVASEKPVHEAHGVRVVQHLSARLLAETRLHLAQGLRDPAGSREDADQLALLVGDGEFPEGTGPAPRDHHDVTAPDVHQLAPHETEAREDQDVVLAVWRPKHIDVLA